MSLKIDRDLKAERILAELFELGSSFESAYYDYHSMVKAMGKKEFIALCKNEIKVLEATAKRLKEWLNDYKQISKTHGN